MPDDSVDYFFSFGVFCHLKPEMCETYLTSLAKKMRAGSHAFLMIADYDKYNYCLDNADRLSIKRFFASRKVWLPARLQPVIFIHLEMFSFDAARRCAA